MKIDNSTKFQSNYCVWIMIFGLAMAGCDTKKSEKPVPEMPSVATKPVAKSPDRSPSLDFLDRWDELAVSETGGDQAGERSALLEEAVKALGNGSELARFIEGLYDRRETVVVDQLLAAHKKAMFSGRNGVDAREWLSEVKDQEFRKRLTFDAGYYFTGPGLKEHLEKLAPPAVQERFLTGYASRLAESDPAHGVSEYKALRPPTCGFYGLLDVMDHLNPDGDFPKADALYPDDYDEKNNMAAELRKRLLRRWSSFHPEAAAKYVVETPARVKPETIQVVIAKWAEIKPEDALAWLEQAPAGPSHDAGMEEMARLATKAVRYQDAWKAAAKIGDMNKRVAAATEVFKVWEKADHDPAVKAWVELFPGE